jgi:hypothetical protein
VHAPCEGSGDDLEGRFCEELGRVFDHISKYDTKILFSHFNAKITEKIFSNRQSGKGVHMKL